MSKKKSTEINWIEQYSVWFFQELKQHGYLIDYIREPEVIECAPKLKHLYLKRFVRKQNEPTEYNLFQDINYTYDYKLIWDKKARYIFYDLIDKDNQDDCFLYGRPPFIANYDYTDDTGEELHVTRLDVKPTSSVAMRGGRVSSSYTFYLKQRLAYERYGTYIEKFIPIPMAGAGIRSSRFINIFTPTRYLFTDGGKQTRKIKFGITNIGGYVSQRLQVLDKMNKLN